MYCEGSIGDWRFTQCPPDPPKPEGLSLEHQAVVIASCAVVALLFLAGLSMSSRVRRKVLWVISKKVGFALAMAATEVLDSVSTIAFVVLIVIPSKNATGGVYVDLWYVQIALSAPSSLYSLVQIVRRIMKISGNALVHVETPTLRFLAELSVQVQEELAEEHTAQELQEYELGKRRDEAHGGQPRSSGRRGGGSGGVGGGGAGGTSEGGGGAVDHEEGKRTEEGGQEQTTQGEVEGEVEEEGERDGEGDGEAERGTLRPQHLSLGSIAGTGTGEHTGVCEIERTLSSFMSQDIEENILLDEAASVASDEFEEDIVEEAILSFVTPSPAEGVPQAREPQERDPQDMPQERHEQKCCCGLFSTVLSDDEIQQQRRRKRRGHDELGIMMLAVSQALPFKSKRERADEGSMQDREQRKVQVQATHRRLVRVFDARGDEGGDEGSGGRKGGGKSGGKDGDKGGKGGSGGGGNALRKLLEEGFGRVSKDDRATKLCDIPGLLLEVDELEWIIRRQVLALALLLFEGLFAVALQVRRCVCVSTMQQECNTGSL